MMNELLNKYWGKTPFVIRRSELSSSWILPQREIFEAMKNVSLKASKSNHEAMIRIYIDNNRQERNLSSFLPHEEDVDLIQYFSRLVALYNGSEITVNVASLQSYSYVLWKYVCKLLGPLYKAFGLPSIRTDLDIFLGNYKKTPFGLHKDIADNISFVLQGRKRMRVWPYEIFSSYCKSVDGLRQEVSLEGVIDYEEYKDQSIVLEGEPGDILYWPSTYWHIGEAAEDFHASVNLSFYSPSKPIDQLSEMLRQGIEKKLGNKKWVGTYPWPVAVGIEPTSLPEGLLSLQNNMQQYLEGIEFKVALTALWLNRLTGFGFVKVPPKAHDRVLLEYPTISADVSFPILWDLVSSNKLLVSANGHCILVPYAPLFVELLKRLNRGEVIDTKYLTVKMDDRYPYSFLNALYQMRGVECLS